MAGDRSLHFPANSDLVTLLPPAVGPLSRLMIRGAAGSAPAVAPAALCCPPGRRGGRSPVTPSVALEGPWQREDGPPAPHAVVGRGRPGGGSGGASPLALLRPGTLRFGLLRPRILAPRRAGGL